MIVILKILLHNVHKIINLRYPTYVYQFLIFLMITKNRVLACFETRAQIGNPELTGVLRLLGGRGDGGRQLRQPTFFLLPQQGAVDEEIC